MKEKNLEAIRHPQPVETQEKPNWNEFSSIMLRDHFISDEEYAAAEGNPAVSKSIVDRVNEIDKINEEHAEDLRIPDEYMDTLTENGFVVLDNGSIDACGNAELGTIIPGVAYAQSGNYRVCVMNTINMGFRFVSVASDGHIVDMGPVRVPVIVGTMNCPYGVYVPLDFHATRYAADVLYNAVEEYYANKRAKECCEHTNVSQSSANIPADCSCHALEDNSESENYEHKNKFYWMPSSKKNI